MSLETPIKIRMLQRKLYQKAKEEPSYRFYLLYDKMHREDVLAHAYALVKSNQGAPGVDGQSFWGIASQGLEEWLRGIRDALRAKKGTNPMASPGGCCRSGPIHPADPRHRRLISGLAGLTRGLSRCLRQIRHIGGHRAAVHA